MFPPGLPVASFEEANPATEEKLNVDVRRDETQADVVIPEVLDDGPAVAADQFLRTLAALGFGQIGRKHDVGLLILENRRLLAVVRGLDVVHDFLHRHESWRCQPHAGADL